MPQNTGTLIADGHLDIAYSALLDRRDVRQPVTILREREGGALTLSKHRDALRQRKGPWRLAPGPPTVSLPDMRRGRVGLAVASITAVVGQPSLRLGNAQRTPEAAYAFGMAQLAYYEALEGHDEIVRIRDPQGLQRCVEAWNGDPGRAPVGVILSMESADPIQVPEQVEQWWEAGVRSVSLTHSGANTWGHGTGTKGGLYTPAYPLMDALKNHGMVLDVTHASDISFWQIMDAWEGPVHASHCNCRALVPGQRHLSDPMIKELIARGGVIGVVFAEQMLNPDCNWDDPSTRPPFARRSMSTVVEHVDHICQLAGDSEHVAIGSDLDGGFGRELVPTDLDTIADLQRFLSILERHGYGQEDIRQIAHGNLVRLFDQAWRNR